MPDFSQRELHLLGEGVDLLFHQAVRTEGNANYTLQIEANQLLQKVRNLYAKHLADNNLNRIKTAHGEVHSDLVVGCRCRVIKSGHPLNGQTVRLESIEYQITGTMQPRKAECMTKVLREAIEHYSDPEAYSIKTWVIAGISGVGSVPATALVRLEDA